MDKPADASNAAAAVVDLTDQPTTNTYMKEYAAQYEKDITGALTPPRKRQKRRGRSAPSSAARPKDVDAVYVDALDDPTKQTAGEATKDAKPKSLDYRQVLGPLRMAFIDTFATAHNVTRSAGHAFAAQMYAAAMTSFSGAPAALPTAKPSTTKMQLVYKELTEFQLNLPVETHSAIYCRALESDMTRVRVLITGPLDSPYAAGCFLFDVELFDYPNRAPSVRFLTTGGGKVRFNPNLYNDGKVCLSLLGTWSGPGWQPNKSTLLQVLISIQGLILVNDPYYNEPAFDSQRGTPGGEKASDNYNRNLYPSTLQWGILDMIENGEKHYPEFYPIIQRHFAYHADFVRQKMKEWKGLNGSMSRFIPRVEAALASLPPLVAPQVKRPPRKPETISLLDDDDDDEEEDKKQSAKPRSSAKTGKTPETIDLVE